VSQRVDVGTNVFPVRISLQPLEQLWFQQALHNGKGTSVSDGHVYDRRHLLARNKKMVHRCNTRHSISWREL